MTIIDYDLTENIRGILVGKNVFVITDKNVDKYYGRLFEGCKKFVVEPGEDSKRIEVLGAAASEMLESGMDRKSKVVAVGGGVVGDLAGFTAAVFMRGIEWINIPTTLLAQVDSSVGGKTAVNLSNYKNILGVFHNPSQVFISLNFLKTLSDREKLCGIGEVIKTAFLDNELFEFIDQNFQKLLSFDSATLETAVKKCVELKEYVVQKDPTETLGYRKILNLGHTIGHALEREDGHKLSHGEYVLWGLLLEGFIAKNYIPLQQYLYRCSMVKKVLKGRQIKFDSARVAKAAKTDKKNEDGKISIIAYADRKDMKELFFTEKEIFEGLELCKKEFSL